MALNVLSKVVLVKFDHLLCNLSLFHFFPPHSLINFIVEYHGINLISIIYLSSKKCCDAI